MFQLLKVKVKENDTNDMWNVVLGINESVKETYIIKKTSTLSTNNYFDKLLNFYSAKAEYLNEKMTGFLNEYNPSELYKTFKIPKNSGGYREINEPFPELKRLQKELADFLVINLDINPTPWAYAYSLNRDIIQMAKNHQNSKYFLKMDIHHFFNNIDFDILYRQLNNIYQLFHLNGQHPFFLDNLIRIALRNDELPQGSPLSPVLSNLVAAELDYEIKNNEKIKNLYYTRYADDLVFSSQSYISKSIVETEVDNILSQLYNNKIKLNKDKTKVLTKNQRCYIVGVKINKDNQLSFGHEKKKVLKLQLFNLFKAKQNGEDVHDQAQEILGLFNYMAQIEPTYAKYLRAKLCNKFRIPYDKFYKYLIN